MCPTYSSNLTTLYVSFYVSSSLSWYSHFHFLSEPPPLLVCYISHFSFANLEPDLVSLPSLSGRPHLKAYYLKLSEMKTLDERQNGTERVTEKNRRGEKAALKAHKSCHVAPGGKRRVKGFKKLFFCGFGSTRTLPYFSHFRLHFPPPSCVTGVTSRLFSIIWWFRPWKPYIFWTHVI